MERYSIILFNNNCYTSARWIWHIKARSAELVLIISYPTSTSGIIVFFKNAHKILIFSLFLILSRLVQFNTVFGEHGIMAHIP